MTLPTLRWPNGKLHACTTSWDDGVTQDRKIVALFNKHGLKGTFNLNSGNCTGPNAQKYIPASEVASLYHGHEIAVHGASHPFATRIPRSLWLEEVVADKRALEDLVEYPIRGAAWPYGDFHPDCMHALRAAGIRYCRSIKSTGMFDAPDEDQWLAWKPSCHHRHMPPPAQITLNLILDLCWKALSNAFGSGETGDPQGAIRFWNDFRKEQPAWNRPPRLFFLWSHSYEMDEENGWTIFESFCKQAGPDKDVWHATNIEVYDYIMAWRSLSFSCDGKMIHNPSALSIWADFDRKILELKPGASSVI